MNQNPLLTEEMDDLVEPDDIDDATPTLAREDELAPGLALAISPALVDVLGPDFPLPTLVRFVADVRLRDAAAEATGYALGLDVTGADGLARADLALTALRARQDAITAHFAEPADLAHKLHKRLTGLRAEWLEPGEGAIKTVGRRIWTERQRLDAIAAEERRKAQAEADRQAREAAKREADAAARAKAPAPVVEEMKRQAETATAPPVPAPAFAPPAMRGNTTTTTWKARLIGTPADAEPNPKMAELSPAQQAQVKTLLKAVLDGAAPLTALELNWSVLNGRAKSDKSTLAIPGIESFTDGGVRAKGRRL